MDTYPVWGNYLFHYTSASALIGMFSRRKIWATDFQYLNDALEGKLLTKRLLEMSEAPHIHFSGLQFPKKHLDALRMHVGRGKIFYVASFSKRPDMLTQFRMYCPPAGGFVIGFPREYLERVGVLVDVEYDRSHDAWCSDFFCRFMVAARAEDRGELSSEQLEYAIACATSLSDERSNAGIKRKSDEFASEEEVRLVYTGSIANNVRASRQGNLLVPYVELDLPNEAIQVQIGSGPGRHRDLAHQSIVNLTIVARESGTLWQVGQLGNGEFSFREI